MDTRTPTFQVNHLEHVLILTPLVDRLTGNNAAWLRERMLNYFSHERPAQVVLNLLNIYHMDRLGVGVLVSLSSRLKPKSKLLITGLTPQVEAELSLTRLDALFPILTAESACLVCQRHQCEHTLIWQDRLLEFWLQGLTPAEYPQAEPQASTSLARRLTGALIPPRQGDMAEVEGYLRSHTYQRLDQQRQQREGLLRFRDYLLVGGLSALFVLVGVGLVLIGLNSQWVDAFDQSKSTLQRPKYKTREEKPPLTRDELISRFDRDGDGLFSKDDWVLLNSSEKLYLINQGFQERRLRQGLP
jgi:anti-anti-sigma factor